MCCDSQQKKRQKEEHILSRFGFGVNQYVTKQMIFSFQFILWIDNDHRKQILINTTEILETKKSMTWMYA